VHPGGPAVRQDAAVPRPRSFRRPLLAVGGGAVTGVVVIGAVLAVEVVVAGRGPRVIELDPRAADGLVEAPGGAGGAVVDVTWLGDSTAAGVGASGPAQMLATQVARATGRPTRLAVRAVSGARVADAVEQASGVAPDTDLVVVSVGANDATHSVGTGAFRADYERLLRALPPAAGVVLLGVPDIGAATRLAVPLRQVAAAQGRRVDAEVRAVAAAHGAAYVDIAGRTGPSFRADPDRYLAADHYHPNDEGYRLWLDATLPAVTGVLAGR
jgi:lysophospholipase L1-like esterase